MLVLAAPTDSTSGALPLGLICFAIDVVQRRGRRVALVGRVDRRAGQLRAHRLIVRIDRLARAVAVHRPEPARDQQLVDVRRQRLQRSARQRGGRQRRGAVRVGGDLREPAVGQAPVVRVEDDAGAWAARAASSPAPSPPSRRWTAGTAPRSDAPPIPLRKTLRFISITPTARVRNCGACVRSVIRLQERVAAGRDLVGEIVDRARSRAARPRARARTRSTAPRSGAAPSGRRRSPPSARPGR